MNSELLSLSAASAAFVGLHLFLSSSFIRRPLINRLGNLAFQGLYSLVVGVCFTWMIWAFIQAPVIEAFEPNTGMRHLSLSVMAIACFFLVCGYTQPNPTAIGMESRGLDAGARGVLKITRHPVMWGIVLWALCHVLANGHWAALIFFGALAVLAISGTCHIDAKKRARNDPDWNAYMQVTSNFPMAAIAMGKTRVERGEYRWWQILISAALYMGLLVAHEPVIGRYVMPF